MKFFSHNLYSTTSPKRKATQAGFTLLLAALVASVVVSLGAAIFQVARKQVLLSGIGRDSQFAFYAADTAAECALYWDFRFGYFAANTPAGITPTCDGQPMGPVTVIAGDPSTFPSVSTSYTKSSALMNIFQATPPGYCAVVTVEKRYVSGAIRSTIRADGYSVSCAQVATSPRALQRSIELNY